jgi:hypothetical protein
VLEFNAAVYLTEWEQMLFARQHSVGDAATEWDQFRKAYLEANHTSAAMKELLSSKVDLTKYTNSAAFQKFAQRGNVLAKLPHHLDPKMSPLV